MSTKNEKDQKPGKPSWTQWLKQRGLGLDVVDEKCGDREFRTARSNDLNFAIAGGRGGGRVYPRSGTGKRKTRCDRN